jgi:Cu/Ag efflux pump CusA
MPLVVASGAGAASQQAIGTAVVGGMIAATFMSLLFTPVFYVVMQRLSGLGKKKQDTGQAPKKGVVKQAPAK